MEGAISESQTLKAQLQRLLQLQALDRKIQDWERQRQELADKVGQSKAQVQQSQANQAELKKAFETQQKSRGMLELEIKSKQDAIKKYNGQLGELKSNEAYSAMLAEIKKCQEDIAQIEEKIIQLMENEESSKKKYEEEARALAEKTKQAETQQAGMLAEAKAFEDKVAGEQAQRKQLLDSLDKDISDTYTRFFKPKKGLPVARIIQEACEGCKMKVPQHLINEARKVKGISYCQHCGRILIAEDAVNS